MKIIDGKEISGHIKHEIAKTVEEAKLKGFRAPHLGAILVGEDGGSKAYIKNIEKHCNTLGIQFSLFEEKNNISENQLLEIISSLNKNPEIDGFIIQFPLPRHIDNQKIIESIDPRKDIDGMNPVNVGRAQIGLISFHPATPSSVIELIKRCNIETTGKHAVVLGRSEVIGRPVASILMRKGYPGDCTVTVCHSKTEDISSYTKQADILIAAIGKPGFVSADMVKEGAVVIDVGTTMVEDNTKKSGFRLCGDVDFDKVAPKCSYITPVPGGVGPMTVCCLLLNLIKAWEKY